MKLKVWLDSGANIDSCFQCVYEIDDEEWEAMSEANQEQYAKELAFDRSDWGFEVI